ncbi:MAG TPA: family 20 glycosylhydrolase, partial [Acidobacteriaceae bacterium]|nr:family 20 glycosylhydrolase [Acidobacteriaceae bacterium]
DPIQQLGEDESYELQVTPTAVHLRAANPLGVLHGLQTFLQLVRVSPSGFSLPAVTIRDQPRFPWRGLMIDSGRHFMPVEVIERNLDGMEAVKLNVFHWHLSDDQGFRVESKRFPLLQEKGSDGLYYTQDQIRGILSYARDRGIRVVPEFDMPCHTTSWFVGYPELASGKGPYEIERHWGVMNPAMDPTREDTYQFLDAFLGEMTSLFPDAYFHIGGDECNGKEWNANPRIQEFMRAHGIQNNAALQAYFTQRVQGLVAHHGKIMEGWDEVLQPDTPKDVVIQSWRGQASLAEAASRGYRGILSNGYYIDINQSAAEHYQVDPLGPATSALTAQQKQNILGGEATMWSEYVTPENVDSRIWPRTAAIAERLWSPQSVQSIPSMYARLAAVSTKLTYDGLQHQSSYPMMLRRMTGDPDPVPLRVLGNVVQPPRLYVRRHLGSYDAFTPLNRLVDAVPPESDTARRFLDLANRLASQKATPPDWDQARQLLTRWRDNDGQLQPMLGRSHLTEDLRPVSAHLKQVAEIGLEAADLLQHHRASTSQWRARQLAILQKAGQPEAVVVNMVVPAVTQLVEATARR